MKALALFISIFITACSSSVSAEPAASSTLETEAETTETKTVAVSVLKDVGIIYRVGTSNDGVANIMCLPDEHVVGGGCACTGLVEDQEDGDLFACTLNGTQTGYVGGCFSNYLGQPVVPINVRLVCLKGVSVDVVAAAPGLKPVDAVETLVRKQVEAHRAKTR